MRFSLLLACAAAVATASPIAQPSKQYDPDFDDEAPRRSSAHESIPEQLENLSKLSDRVTVEVYKFQGGDFSSLESLLYQFSSATDELSFTADDGKKAEKLDEEDSEEVLDALPYTEIKFRTVMLALEEKKRAMSTEQKKVVANILYNTKVSISMLMSGIADITTRHEDINYLTKPYEDDIFRTWRAFEQDANPDWYVSDQNQIDDRIVTSHS
jgi:hypothetical protein